MDRLYKIMKPDYSKHMPAKRMGAGALFFNERNELLILKQSYNDLWSIPGGIVDDHESPLQAVLREIKEEIGLTVQDVEFLGVNYVGHTLDRSENVQFIFYGGILDSHQISSIQIDNDEIVDFKFLPLKEALSLVNERLKIRIPKCIEMIGRKTGVYFEI